MATIKEVKAKAKLNLDRLLAGEYCQSCKSHRLSLTDDLMISCKDCCEESSFAPILLIEYLTVCRDLLKAKNLIAASPDLLEACQRLHNRFSNHPDLPSGFEATAKLDKIQLDFAQAAISKALPPQEAQDE